MTDWRSRWTATVFSDVADRDGLGWEFAPATGSEVEWEVFREDGGPFPVFSSTRGSGPPPPAAERAAMTAAAVADLLAAAGLTDPVGFHARNLTAALVLAGERLDRWEGVEWAVESDMDDRPSRWAGPTAERTPYAWLRAVGAEADHVVSVYQDDLVFGLALDHGPVPELPAAGDGSTRPHGDIPLVTGEIVGVEIAFDTLADGGHAPGVLAEVHLHGERGATLLVAAEAHDRDDWRRYDESVVALADPSRADTLAWHPPRPPWSFGGGHR